MCLCFLQLSASVEGFFIVMILLLGQDIYDLVPKGVHENRTKGVENKVDDTLKLAVLECAQC